jgi:hypothetical protein
MKRFKLYWFFRKLYDRYLRKKDESLIPKGVYCHTHGFRGLSCPYLDTNPYAHDQDFGYCSFLAMGDWESDKLGLLWDACKECNINEEDE